MFGALFLKEWKEKALVFYFGLGILVVFFVVHLAWPGKKDLLEWLTYAVLLLFFPFLALVLGSGGFESEYRDGAWAYLFSRPVKKAFVWLAKYVSLLSMLLALWLVFLAVWFFVPALNEFAGGTRILLGFKIETGFPFWSLLQSVFFLTVAFSLSILHEKQFNILFLSLILGLGLTAAVWLLALTSGLGARLAWTAPAKAVTAFLVSEVLIALAFAAASILTFVRSDFSQFRKKTLSFVRWGVPFLVVALACTAAWAVFAPGPEDRYISCFYSSGQDSFYMTQRGIFKYSATADKVRWLVKTNRGIYFLGSAAAGKIVYEVFDVRSKTEVAEELWVVSTDGKDRRRLLPAAGRGSIWPGGMSLTDVLMSPDGTKIMMLAQRPAKMMPGERSPLWVVNADGTGLENLPAEPELLGTKIEPRAYVYFVAWVQDGGGVLITQRFINPATNIFRLWIYDLKSHAARLLLDNALAASWFSPLSPRGDRLAIKYQKTAGKPWALALLDLRTLGITDLTGGEGRVWSSASWDKTGDRLAYIVRRPQAGGPDAYVLAVYSMAAGKTVSEKTMTTKESDALLLSPSWTAEGVKLLVLDRTGHALKVLGPDLSVEKTIAIPASVRLPAGLVTAGDRVLVEDGETDTLWRLDLRTGSWKKVF